MLNRKFTESQLPLYGKYNILKPTVVSAETKIYFTNYKNQIMLFDDQQEKKKIPIKEIYRYATVLVRLKNLYEHHKHDNYASLLQTKKSARPFDLLLSILPRAEMENGEIAMYGVICDCQTDDRDGDDVKAFFNYFIPNIKAITEKIKENFSFKAAEGIDWSIYFPPNDDRSTMQEIAFLIDRAPSYMQEWFQHITALETAKYQHLTAKFNGDDSISTQLIEFRRQIYQMEIKKVDKNTIANFKDLANEVERELLSTDASDLKYAAHPIVLTEFTQLAKLLAGGIVTKQEMDEFKVNLEKKIEKQKPMSPALKTKICLAIGVVVGAVVGFAIGAAITFWGCGFGGIAGAIAGITLAQGLILGGATVGGATLAGSTAAVIGYRNAKKKFGLFEIAQDKLPETAFTKHVDNAIKSIRPQD